MSTLNEQYKKCKIQIKLWEHEFRKREKRVPSKDDIKVAPINVKEAYKQYWLAKTSILEEAILDDDDERETSSSDKNHENDNSSLNTITSRSREEFPAQATEMDSVWGEHLKKAVEKSKETRFRKSSSFEFTEKLFKGVKLKKRNPRKLAVAGTKLLRTESMPVESSSQVSDSGLSVETLENDKIVHGSALERMPILTESSCEGNSDTCVSSLIVDSPEEGEEAAFSFKPVRITTGKSLASVQPVNIMQAARKSANFRAGFKSKLNEGWLQRCDQQCTFSQMKGQNDDTPQTNNHPNDDTSKPRTSDFSSLNDSSTLAGCSDDDYVFSDDEEKVSKPKNKSEPVNLSFGTEDKKPDGNPVTLAKPKIRNPVVGCIISKPAHEKRSGDELTGVTKKVKILSASSDNERKLDRMRKKLEDGSINDNFVRIDLKHKRYSRGKKSISSSNQKVQQWKMKKRVSNAVHPSSGSKGVVLTCFRCGDVGHFMRQCKKQDTLLPREEGVEEEDDSPFPTLEEAAEMVKEKISNKNEVQEILEQFTEIDEPQPEDGGYLKAVQPLYECNEDGSVKQTPDEVLEALYEFGYENFRPGQENAIMRILSGKSTLVISGTGSGKSLCYQIPAYVYAKRYKCISLVISPLVSLMEDQVLNFPSCVQAACLHTNQTPAVREKVLQKIANNDISVLLVSPEAMVSGERGILGQALVKNFPSIAFVCIDEVHCVSQWSHNFRTSYLIICNVLRERFNINVFLGLTATASKGTISSITKHLGIFDESRGVVQEDILPDNLILSTSRDESKDSALLSLLKQSPFAEFESIIIYCLRRNECERLASFLRASLQNFRKQKSSQSVRSRISDEVEVYHAGISAARRKRVQNNFMKGKLRIVIATVAFGMGINKADIRGIIHYNMPRTFEHYVQEIGRAGRDGLPARCHMFYSVQGADLPELKRHIFRDSLDRPTIRKFLFNVFVQCSCVNVCRKHELAFPVEKTVADLDIPQENISTLLCYLELLPDKIVEVLPATYTRCTVVSYNGILGLKRAAKKCPPLAFAIAEHCKKTNSSSISSKLEFSVIELADKIGWESGTVKRELKRCEWTFVNEKWKKTGIGVTFDDLGFHVRAPGNLTETQLDDALNMLYSRVTSQENTALHQLEMCNKAFECVTYSSVVDAIAGKDLSERNTDLRRLISTYFNEESESRQQNTVETAQIKDEEAVMSNIYRLVSEYRDCTFTGRAIARLFHGIESPNFPAMIWGRTPYWRCALREDFNAVYRMACVGLMKLT